MKKNIWRILFWGLILLVCLTLGIVGFLENKRINDVSEIKLNDIKDILDDSYIINTYKEANVQINTSVKGNNLTITFSSAVEHDYVYTLKGNILNTEYDKTDETSIDILMAVTDSIAVLNGENSDNVYSIFRNNEIDNYTLDEGIEITYNNNQANVKLNINKAVTPRITTNDETSYFTFTDFTEEDITNHNFTKSKSNLILIRENETEFALAETNTLSSNTLESLKNIIIYFYGTEYSNELNNIDFDSKANYTSELIEITFNPEKNEYELNNITSNHEFIRVKINNI